ncbi:Putative cysteine protease atg4 [Hirsutella minnesotensis 3608]|uniref:Cysteine protease n=1 Tax=Hirsutella minnesotensis 3608 TaxID=1043627 RepID=A0A0F7ZRY0_9HYPO|nr:Putative cysteine protease atg4 [Hirsutella minnesotensis 3608]
MESTIAKVDLGRYRRIVQMFWDPEPANDTSLDQPVWCLGCSYKLADSPKSTRQKDDSPATRPSLPQSHPPTSKELPKEPLGKSAPDTPPQSSPGSYSSSLGHGDPAPGDGGWPHEFIDDFRSRFWMTYRSGFELISKSNDPNAASTFSLSMRIKNQISDQGGFVSDSGWGCMIRSGQSLLANAMALLQFGRDWRRGERAPDERRLVSLFADDPRAPYSIHNFVRHGAAACGKYPGEWFGPSATARCIQALVNQHEPSLRVYLTGDGPDVYEDNFMKIARPGGGEFHPTLVLVGTRLGIDKITPVYWEALIASLQMRQSVGIAGGRPSSSHYFVGAQGSFLFYLDPHHTRTALPYHADADEYADDEIESCHTARLRRIHIREVDPSMLIGFLIRSEDDWLDWRRCVKHVQGKAIIHVADHDMTTQSAKGQREDAINEVEPLSDESDSVISA